MENGVQSSEDEGYRNRQREPILPDAVLGMGVFIIAEVMFFAGFISGHVILRNNSPGGWPPPNQPRLPVEATAFNTFLLLLSGVALYVAGRRFKSGGAAASRVPFLISVALGLTFVCFQGYEWVGLVAEGLTLMSSSYGSFFYLIVGSHGLHALSAILFLVVLFIRLQRGRLTNESFQAGRMFWYFVVGLWPLLYWQVYLR